MPSPMFLCNRKYLGPTITPRSRTARVPLSPAHSCASVLVPQIELPLKVALKLSRGSGPAAPPPGLVTPQPSDSEGEEELLAPRASVIMRAHKDGTCSPEPLPPPPHVNILKTLKFKMNRDHSYSYAKYVASQSQQRGARPPTPPSPAPPAALTVPRSRYPKIILNCRP